MSDEVAPAGAAEETVQEPTSLDDYKAQKVEAGVADKVPTIAVRDKEFRVAAELPGIVLLDLGLASDPNSTQGEQLRAVRQFLHAAIHEEDVDAFEVLLRTARPVIQMEELNKLVEKLVEQTAGRPTD